MALRGERLDDRGFTLLEILLVVSLLAMLVQVAALNIGTLLPEWRLRSVSQRLATRMNFLASEARIQGTTYKLQFDLDRNRVRTLLPPDLSQALAGEETPEMLKSEWDYLDDPLVIEEIKVGTDDRGIETGIITIPFRPRGTSVDAIIILADPNFEQVRKYLRLQGLNAQVEISDEEISLPRVTDNDFI
jgi:prepilin-type N-terminal cleavage/methylation domain-containing protein